MLILGLLTIAPDMVSAEAGWTSYAHVMELTTTNQHLYLVTLRVAKNPSGCSNKMVFYQNHGARGDEQMFRLLLEAAATGMKVRVYVTGNCELNGYSEISSVSITP